MLAGAASVELVVSAQPTGEWVAVPHTSRHHGATSVFPERPMPNEPYRPFWTDGRGMQAATLDSSAVRHPAALDLSETAQVDSPRDEG